MARVVTTGARVELDDGTIVAVVEAITIGGGTQVITVDGVPEERVHPTFHRFHCRLLSPDRMIPDELRETETFDEATELGLAYAAKRIEHAASVAALADALKV